MDTSITAYIDDLFKYIDNYESNYAAFETEAFFQTYNGIFAVFQALRQEREKAIEIDRIFLEKIKQGPLTSSDLRQLTIQILISFFESVADTDGQSNRAYLYCREFRSVKRDVTYLETYLMPLLTRDGSLNNNFKLNRFFLKEISRFITNFSSGSGGDVQVEEFKAMPDHRKLLELHLRRSKLGDDPVSDRNSLEFHLRSTGVFEKLRQSSPLFEKYLLEWNYLIEDRFIDRLKNSLNVLWGKLKGLFSSYKYLRLSMTQRYSAYLFYGLIILIFLFLAIFVPLRWNSYTDKKLTEFEERVEARQEALGK
jgi:hypothetical protein